MQGWTLPPVRGEVAGVAGVTGSATGTLTWNLSALTERLTDLRAEAMASKDFSAVDALKAALTASGIEVRMSKAGVELVPGPGFNPDNLPVI